MGGVTATGQPAGIDALDGRARARLDRFATAFDSVPATEFHLFAGPAEPGDALREAMAVALRELPVAARRRAVKAAVDRFVAAAEHRYAERFGFAELVGLSPGAPGTAADRVRVFQGLERAVVAVILWDHLDDETRVLLAGPWGALVEYAVGEA